MGSRSDEAFSATVGSQTLAGDAARSLYMHFTDLISQRDTLNHEASQRTYDAQQIEEIAAVVGGEDKARKMLGLEPIAQG